MKIAIGARDVGDGAPSFIIAEAGVNHDGSLSRAIEMVRVAKKCGADAIKFQSFHPEDLASAAAPLARYQRTATRRGRSQLPMLRDLALAEDEQRELYKVSQRIGIQFLSTPFDDRSAQFLADLGVPALKVASGDLTNLPFLRRLASYRRPLILSTGMGTMSEVREAVRTVKRAGNDRLIVLQCTSAYPEPPGEANLRVIPEFRRKLRTLVGFSDHTIGLGAAVGAVALGACIIEKHFTLSRDLPGPDQGASLEPDELSRLVAQIRETEAALGNGVKRRMPSERENVVAARKSVVTRVDIPAGVRLTASMLTVKRPGSGIPPRDLNRLVGRVARVDIPADSLISWKQVR